MVKVRQLKKKKKDQFCSFCGWVQGILHETGSEIVKKGPSQRMYGVKILYGDETTKLKVDDQ